jgi:hypothetical protein
MSGLFNGTDETISVKTDVAFAHHLYDMQKKCAYTIFSMRTHESLTFLDIRRFCDMMFMHKGKYLLSIMVTACITIVPT